MFRETNRQTDRQTDRQAEEVYLSAGLGLLRPWAGQDGEQQPQQWEEHLAITISHTRDKPTGWVEQVTWLTNQMTATMVIRSEVNKVTFCEVVEAVSSNQLSGPGWCVGQPSEEGLGGRGGGGEGGRERAEGERRERERERERERVREREGCHMSSS